MSPKERFICGCEITAVVPGKPQWSCFCRMCLPSSEL